MSGFEEKFARREWDVVDHEAGQGKVDWVICAQRRRFVRQLRADAGLSEQVVEIPACGV